LTPEDLFWALAALGVALILEDIHLDTGIISAVGAACLVGSGYGLGGPEGAAIGAAIGVPITAIVLVGARKVPKGPSRVPEVRDLISERGEVVSEDPLIVRVRGEEWLAEARGPEPSKGDVVRVVDVKGSTILVIERSDEG